jgi:hypothetical protein
MAEMYDDTPCGEPFTVTLDDGVEMTKPGTIEVVDVPGKRRIKIDGKMFPYFTQGPVVVEEVPLGDLGNVRRWPTQRPPLFSVTLTMIADVATVATDDSPIEVGA